MKRYAVAVRLLRLTITVSGRTPIARGKHPVQRADSNRDLGRLTPIDAESQTVPDDTFEAADVDLDQSPPVVTSGLLTSYAARLGDDLQVTITHSRHCLGCITWHGAGAWWDDDGRLRVARGNLAIDAVLIVSTVGRERSNRAIYLMEQGADLGRAIDIADCQRRGRDPSGVHGYVQLAPRAPGVVQCFKQPFAGAARVF